MVLQALELRTLALISLKSQKEAHTLLRRALSVYPDSVVFPALLKQIQTDERKEKEREQDLYKRMMGNMLKTDNQKQNKAKFPELVRTVQKETLNERSEQVRDDTPSPTSRMVEQMLKTLQTSDATEVELNISTLTLDDLKRLHESIKQFPEVEFVHDEEGCRLRKVSSS